MADIYLYKPIGKSFWEEMFDYEDDDLPSEVESVRTGEEMAARLAQIPSDEPINLRINSPGGSVSEGLAIYNLLKTRRENVTAYIDGYAASIASVIPLAAKTVISPESSIWMIHHAAGGCMGTAEDMREMAQSLDVHDKVMLSIYREATGKTDEELIPLLDAETWFTGAEAAEFGFCQVSDEKPVTNVLPIDRFKISASAKERLAAAGWQFMPARKPIAASAKPPIPKEPPMARKTVVAEAETLEQNPAVDVEEEETLTPTVPVEPNTPVADPTIEARIRALESRYAAADRQQKDEIQALRVANEALGGELSKMKRSLDVTARFTNLQAKAQQLVAEFRLKPSEMAELFEDASSVDAVLASDDAEWELKHIEKTLAKAEKRSPGLPTEFATAEVVVPEKTEAQTIAETALARAREKMANAYKGGN